MHIYYILRKLKYDKEAESIITMNKNNGMLKSIKFIFECESNFFEKIFKWKRMNFNYYIYISS